MKNRIIGCRTMEDELRSAISATQNTDEICWLDARLHNVKEELQQAIQEILDNSKGYDRIYLATGFCGNSICGICSPHAPVYLPRADDCITLLMGSRKAKLNYQDSYFFTDGWLRGERNIWTEYQHSLERYGEKRTNRIFQRMFCHYTRFAVLDTGCYPVEPALEKVRQIASHFEKDTCVLSASNAGLIRLLSGPWPEEEFLILPPGEVLTMSMIEGNSDSTAISILKGNVDSTTIPI